MKPSHLTILLIIVQCINAKARIYQVGNLDADSSITTTVEYNSGDDAISIYNTGLELTLRHKDHPQASVYFRGNINGKLTEIDRNNFKIDEFISELKANYEFDRENAVIVFSVGKMVTGTKTNQSSPQKQNGVMGFRLSIKPKKIPMIQEWMKRNKFKITRVDITRYDSESKDSIDFGRLGDTDMTAYALYLSRGRSLNTFIILKQPDGDSNAPRGLSLGGIYFFNLPMRPSLFALYHNSESEIVDIDVYVLSANFMLLEETTFKITWSKVLFNNYGTKSKPLITPSTKSYMRAVQKEGSAQRLTEV